MKKEDVKRVNEENLNVHTDLYDEDDELFMQSVGEALKRHEKKTKLDAAVIEGWVSAANERKRARRRRFAALAACVLIVCGGTVSAMNWLTPGHAIAGKAEPKTTEDGNSTIVKPGDGQPGENIGTDSIVVDDWDKITVVKKKYPQLLIPQYIPEGFVFENLQVEVTELAHVYTYTYNFDNEKILIVQTSNNDFKMIKDFDRILQTPNGIDMKIKEDEGKIGHFLIEDSLCAIMGNILDDEYGKIADELER